MALRLTLRVLVSPTAPYQIREQNRPCYNDGMTHKEIAPWIEKRVTVTLDDGSQHTGTLLDTPEPGLFHVMPVPSRPGIIEGSVLTDLYLEQIVKIEPA